MKKIILLLALGISGILNAQNVEINLPEGSDLIVNKDCKDSIVYIPIYKDTLFVYCPEEPKPSGLIFEQDFEHRETGSYSRSDLIADFTNDNVEHVSYSNANSKIVNDLGTNHTNMLKLTTMAGTDGGDCQNCWWQTFRKDYKEMTLEYDLYFAYDFDSKSKGKLFGLMGRSTDRNSCKDMRSGEFGSLRNMFHGKFGSSYLAFYSYHFGKENRCGDSKNADFKFSRNTWYNMKLKAVVNDLGLQNGKIELWVNDELQGTWYGLMWSDVGEGFAVPSYNFFNQFAIETDNTIYVDNIKVY